VAASDSPGIAAMKRWSDWSCIQHAGWIQQPGVAAFAHDVALLRARLVRRSSRLLRMGTYSATMFQIWPGSLKAVIFWRFGLPRRRF
jgi:hypothetical protein